MFLNVARVKRGGKSYQYGQLVEAYRRDDGMPTRRIIASLGQMTELEIDNFRTALAASKAGERVALPKVVTAHLRRPTQNLRYLDLAVLLAFARGSGVCDILTSLLPQGDSTVAPADVITALVLQRCVDPGSKLYAERWFPRTALPELLGIDPSSFNNTRIHRVLADLDDATPALQDRLPHRLLSSSPGGAATAMFLDITDVIFTSNGPELAERGKTKLGTIDRKVGIVLLCDERGVPLRWQVISGKRAEPDAMHAMVRAIRGFSWTKEAPLVMDRAMGTSHDIRKLLGQGIHFVLALRDNEVMSYAKTFPATANALQDVEPSEREDSAGDERVIADVEHRVVAAGMRRVSSTMFVLDLGVVDRDAPAADAGPPSAEEPPAPAGKTSATFQLPSLVEQLMMARQMVAIRQTDHRSFNATARALGLDPIAAKSFRMLLTLSESAQQRILAGEGSFLSRRRLVVIGRLPAEEHDAALDSAIAQGRGRSVSASVTGAAQGTEEAAEGEDGVRVRAVLAFNPQRFVDERRSAKRLLARIASEVEVLNAKLGKSLSRARGARALDKLLRHHGMLESHDITWTEHGGRPRVALTLRMTNWRRRRAMDGFLLHLAHPEVTLPAEEIARLYRAKDAVEKDFQTIKSFVQIRPIRHFTDAKVRAHVTICVLSLLLERLLGLQLTEVSAQAALETLSTNLLNRFARAKTSDYLLTEPSDEQRHLLRQLKLLPLVDDDTVAATLRPR